MANVLVSITLSSSIRFGFTRLGRDIRIPHRLTNSCLLCTQIACIPCLIIKPSEPASITARLLIASSKASGLKFNTLNETSSILATPRKTFFRNDHRKPITGESQTFESINTGTLSEDNAIEMFFVAIPNLISYKWVKLLPTNPLAGPERPEHAPSRTDLL